MNYKPGELFVVSDVVQEASWAEIATDVEGEL
jgi:hypothetical protein